MLERDPIRTTLFVPGNREERIDKAIGSNADLAIIDLEDAVPFNSKSKARAIAAQKIQEHASKKICVRVNALHTEFFLQDLKEIVVPSLSCLMVPKVESSEQFIEIDRHLRETEKEINVEPGSILIIALIETALGLENVFGILSYSQTKDRILTVAFGAADFALDMGIELTRHGSELAYPRARLAIACRAAAISPPIDSPFMIDLNDLEALEQEARRAKQLGFQGKLCIHPRQIDICNRIFSPSKEDIAYSRRVVQAFEEAENRGLAAIKLDNTFIDYPVVYRAQRILKLSEKLNADE